MRTTLEEAARARALAVQQRSDRPPQRRGAPDSPQRGWATPGVAASLTLRGDNDAGALEFHGVASVTERDYQMWDVFGPYTEVVTAGAFADTLDKVGLDVTLNLGHDQLRRIARTLVPGSLALQETHEGLDVLADLDPADPDVAYIAPKLRSGLVNEMSFAFRIDAGSWSPDFATYRIDKVDLHRGDVAIVGYGASPHTWGGLRSAGRPDRRAVLLAAALAK